MSLSHNKRLYDIATRLAVYVEDVKVWQAQQFNTVLRELDRTITDLLGRVRYKTLDGLSKAQLNKLVVELRESQSKIYSVYANQLIAQLQDFMAADLQVNRRVWVTSRFELDSPGYDEIVTDEKAKEWLGALGSVGSLYGISAITGNDARLWSQIINAPIPANGLYLQPFIKTFAVSAQGGVENIIRKAWANKQPVSEVLTELVGDGTRTQGAASQLDKIRVQATAVISTATAHVAGITAAAVASAVYNKYVWRSVIDSATTPICFKRNGNVYTYGNGPLPPAHIGCRSHTSPYVPGADIEPESFFAWIFRQPATVQDDVLGEDGGERIRDGRLKAKDVKKYESKKPLNYKQFKGKIDTILSR